MVNLQLRKQEAPQRRGPGMFGGSGDGVFAKKPVQDFGTDISKISEDVLNLSRRIKLVEDRMDALRKHFDIIDSSLVDKHKNTIKEFKRVEEDLRSIREQVRENTSMTDRIVKRLEVFATRDKVAVLEKYISMWQPLKYTTAKEVERIVEEKMASLAEKENEENEN